MQVSSNGRVRRTASEWREIFSQHKKSGLSARDFCRKEEIHLSSFQRWQTKLKTSGPSSEFAVVTPASAAPPSWSLEVSLPDGSCLRLEG